MSSARDAAIQVLQRLRAAGHVAYFAGGCVRDRLMGLTPKDYDVATDAEPTIVRKLFPNSQAVGAAFGVILVRLAGQQMEVATFRADGAYSDGRRPDAIRFTTAEEDAKRRDFTINGLFEDPLAETPEGTVIDFVGGQADIEGKILRAIGDPAARFGEDHLRLLRAIRFAARFDLHVAPPTATAIKSLAPMIRRIAPERVGDETRRMLTAPPAARQRAWRLLRELHLLPELLRFVPCADRPEVHVFTAVQGDRISVALACAALLIEEAEWGSLWTKKPAEKAVAGLRQSLCLSNDETEATKAILLGIGPILPSHSPPNSPSLAANRRLLGSFVGSDSLTLLEALSATGIPVPSLPNLRILSTQGNAPAPLVTGDDLVAMGMPPGPKFKTLLASIYDAQLESRVTTREEAMKLIPPHS